MDERSELNQSKTKAGEVSFGEPRFTAYPYVRQMVLDSNGTCVIASETEIREARQMVRELEGIDPCFSSSCAVALLIDCAIVPRRRCHEKDFRLAVGKAPWRGRVQHSDSGLAGDVQDCVGFVRVLLQFS